MVSAMRRFCTNAVERHIKAGMLTNEHGYHSFNQSVHVVWNYNELIKSSCFLHFKLTNFMTFDVVTNVL